VFGGLELHPDFAVSSSTGPFVANAQVNDLRQFKSPPLPWFLVHGVRRSSRKPKRYISNAIMYNPSGALSTELIVPLHEESLIYFTVKMPCSGTIVFSHLHTHQTVFDYGFIVAAMPHELGPLLNALSPRWWYDEIGRPVQRKFLNTIMRSCDYPIYFPSQLGVSGPQLMSEVRRFAGEKIFCEFHGGVVDIDGMLLERERSSKCWHLHFHKDETFTAIGINKATVVQEDKSTWIEQHLTWQFLYYSDNETRSYSWCEDYARGRATEQGCSVYEATAPLKKVAIIPDFTFAWQVIAVFLLSFSAQKLISCHRMNLLF